MTTTSASSSSSTCRVVAKSIVWFWLFISVCWLFEFSFIFRLPRTILRTNQLCNEQSQKNQEEEEEVKTSSSSISIGQKPRHSWCPETAECQNSVLCQPCQRRFLILISEPRAASTTLTWMLDSLPGIRMSGENNDLLTHLQSAISQTTEHSQFRESTTDHASNAWHHNPVLPGSMACSTQSLVHAFNPPRVKESVSDHNNNTSTSYEMSEEESNMILGFKTVRFHAGYNPNDEGSMKNYAKLIQFLVESFPCSKIVLNMRSDLSSHVHSVQAAFGNKDPIEKIETRLKNDQNNLIKVYKDLPKDQVMLMDSTWWTKNVTKLHRLVDWLGYSPECYYSELLEFNRPPSEERTGTKVGYANGKTQFSNVHPDCRYLGLEHSSIESSKR